jgi:hypothetical protein
MFCPCYFNAKPEAHHGHAGGPPQHFCQFNNAFKVNRGHHGAVRLDGAKFWVSGDLGGDLASGTFDWAVVTFDRAMTKEQRDAVAEILGSLYPVKWNSLTTAEGEIAWTAGKESARATIDGGRSAEVALQRPASAAMSGDPVVIKNLKYWGAPRNDGFVLMPNTVEAYRVGEKAFEFKGTNGFMITFDIDSKSVARKSGAAGR